MTKFFTMMLFACLLCVQAKAQDNNAIGSVTEPEYHGATGTLPSQENQQLMPKTAVFAKEVIDARTGRTSLVFNDGTSIDVGIGSNLTLDSFVYDAKKAQGASGVINFGTGTFRFISGSLHKDTGLRLNTPVASMVIRGTNLVIWVDQNGQTKVSVIEGKIEIEPCPEKKLEKKITVNEGDIVTIDINCEVTVSEASPPAGPGRQASPD